ncbi:MAG: (2Fe-2S)-binding protein [Pyrinomonadaceae bacterium]|nr:(2Fe-2S)-binding protein [Pyrinomonadaceae bacterium]
MKLEDYKDVFEPFDRLVEIEILGIKVKVPENNTLLRCFQFLSIETVSLGDFCWNGDCANCRVWLESTSKDKPVLSCRTTVKEGMKIVKMADEISLKPSGDDKSEVVLDDYRAVPSDSIF